MKTLREMLVAEAGNEVKEAVLNYTKYLTEKECAKITEGKKSIEDYIAKITKKVNKSGYAAEQLAKYDAVITEDRKVSRVEIEVDWIRSRMWGSNPKATVNVHYTNGNMDRFVSERISGCGYDKESTATGQALNQCHALLKALYAIKEANMDQSNRACIGYGSGYGLLPYFEGGVGFSCHRRILEVIGLKVVSDFHSHSGNTAIYMFQADN